MTVGRLLIVDDDASVRRALGRLLRKEGYEIFLAEGAAMADRILESESIDVILCDQDMPGRTGIEFLMDAARRYPHQRRLLVSGRFQSLDVAQAMDCGAIDKFMVKPWDDAILKADIRASFRDILTQFSGEPNARQTSASSSPGELPSGHGSAWAAHSKDRILSAELHTAAKDGSLSLAYQPQVNFHDNAVCGFEALLRWSSSIGPIGPDHFIGLAERNGSMSKLTHWVFEEACRSTQRWLNDWRDAKVSLNISPVDLRDDALITHAQKLVTQHIIPAGAIQIEVTESEALQCDDVMRARLARLVDLGFELAIDDFGAGATTLAYLAELPFTTLKLDRSLTQQLTTPKGHTIVQKVLEMARGLGMKTTLEGIETEEQAALARTIGADAAQGYYFAKPTHKRTVEQWIAAGCNGAPK
ncbi:MAG: EAL domain-containing response regulator [Pseudomonadota bacterium]